MSKAAPASPHQPTFTTDNKALQAKWDKALVELHGNVEHVAGFADAVLIEGGGYPGIWLECGPLESLVYEPFAPAVARASHEVFFAHQRADGNLPCYVWKNHVGRSQIQMVVPIAATALEVAERQQRDDLLSRTYEACGRWDAWLVANRNTRGTGLCEIFCGYDTGHDNSARFAGLPWACPDDDAAKLPHIGALPYLGPDVSATMYGGRVALARMARLLGKASDEAHWLEHADDMRKAIMRHCFDESDACFYDRDANNNFVRIRHDALTRVVGEHVVDQALFDEIWRRHLGNPQRFWTPLPFPSIAIDDPAFDKALPDNSWGGPSQALTALRTPRWMNHYGRHAAATSLMQKWCNALVMAPEFMQQANPWTAQMSTSKRYSPAMLTLVEFTARLHGVHRDGEQLAWNVRLPAGANAVTYQLPLQSGAASISTQKDPQGRVASKLSVGNASVFVSGCARLLTSPQGVPVAIIGTAERTEHVEVKWQQHAWQREVAPEQVVTLPTL